jgi:predicted nucleic acid-binding protein
LIGLAIVDGLKWLPEIFGTVFLHESVKQEVLPGKSAHGEDAISHAIDAGWLKVWPEPIESQLDIDLDAGETGCINLGLSQADEVLLVMNELILAEAHRQSYQKTEKKADRFIARPEADSLNLWCRLSL